MRKDISIELFLLQVRGAVAAAFTRAGVVPTNEQWEALRGGCDFTMRDLAEIGDATGVDFQMNFQDKLQPEAGMQKLADLGQEADRQEGLT